MVEQIRTSGSISEEYYQTTSQRLIEGRHLSKLRLKLREDEKEDEIQALLERLQEKN